jgi:hypothetical protein
MTSPLVRYLLGASGILLLMLIAFLVGFGMRKPDGKNIDAGNGSKAASGSISPGKTVERSELPSPPPPPRKVGNPDRVRSNLQPGKTYLTHSKGTLHVRGEDRDWGFGTVVTINYAFEAKIDREIESNDGTTIVELRHFREIRSVKVDTRLENLRIDLGDGGDVLFAGLLALSAFQPEAGQVAELVKRIDGLSLRPALQALRWAGISPEKLSGLDQATTRMITQVSALSGKKVRLTFIDGKGVIKVEAVQGEMTPQERDFHLASSLLSDSLIIPDMEIKEGIRWTVDGSNFANLIDPNLLARTAGEVTLERDPDHRVAGRTCRHLRVVEGRIRIDDSDQREGRIGHFDPQGSLYFSPEDQVIIKATLSGKAKLERFSKDHLLFEARMRRQPDLEVRYTCRVVDTASRKEP